jgi:C-terminal processing protease CtpA/Prc
MNKVIILSLFFIFISDISISQTLEDNFSQEKMLKDLEIFKNIRLEANSGLYKYRTKHQIDSIYSWAENEIKNLSTYGDFYNIICQLTDFEGSSHNSTKLPSKISDKLRNEVSGYFPYSVKNIENKWIINYDNKTIPLGSEIISINNERIEDIIRNLYKYYATDGVNTTGKQYSLVKGFSRYYRYNYGLKSQFIVEYRTRNSKEIKKATLNGVSYKDYIKNANKRYSRPFDTGNYKDWKENEIYSYKAFDKEIGILTVNSFSLGNEKDPRHHRYVAFLDSVFIAIKQNNIKNLIVDVRYNGGGTDPNDLVTYSYLTHRNFQENTQAWISFKKIPYLKYVYSKIPRFLRPLGVRKYNREFQKEFSEEKNGKFYQNSTSNDHRIWKPNENTFNGNVYLLISPRVASAGSLFAAMIAGNKNAVVIGEETMGGYYGHNGHTPLGYILPNSKIETFFSVVNLEQDVPKKTNQIYNRGVIPDYNVAQTYDDYINHKDTQMNFVIDLIKNNKEIAYHPIVLKVKETSLYSDQINWREVNSEFIKLVKGKENTDDLKKGLQYLINSLGDKHGNFRSAKDHSIIVSYNGEIKGIDNRNSEFVSTVINDISAKFSYQILEDGIGYLKIVGIGPGDVKEQADFIREGLIELKAKGVEKWIVDLRFNGGGNMEPMISGLAPLIGEGFVAGAINKDNEIRDFTIENGQFFNYGRLVCEMNSLPEIKTNEKVAVLLSRYTISSGELVAIAFKGRKNTIFIGEETAGYTTGNGYDKIDDELVIVISQDVFIDRNKNRYDNKVGVDENIEFQHSISFEDDNQINRAKAWLNE